MTAITTKYIGQTDTKPARIKVSYEGKSKTYSYNDDDCQNARDAHAKAAKKFVAEFCEWVKGDEFVCGDPGGSCYIFIPANTYRRYTF